MDLAEIGRGCAWLRDDRNPGWQRSLDAESFGAACKYRTKFSVSNFYTVERLRTQRSCQFIFPTVEHCLVPNAI